MTSDFPSTPQRLAYGIAEAAQLTGLGRTTLYEMISKGELLSSKVGRRRLILAESLHRLICAIDEKPGELAGCGSDAK